MFLQARGAVLWIAPPPLADRKRAGGKEPGGGLNAALFGTFHQLQTMVVGVSPLTHQIAVAGGSNYGATTLDAARRPAFPPAGRPSPSPSSDSYTSTALGGNDVPFQFQASGGIDRGARLMNTSYSHGTPAKRRERA